MAGVGDGVTGSMGAVEVAALEVSGAGLTSAGPPAGEAGFDFLGV